MIHASGLVTSQCWAASAGNTALWTPSQGKRWRMTRLHIYVTGNAAIGSKGSEITVSLYDGTTSMDIAWSIYLPAASVLSSLPGVLQTWNTTLNVGGPGAPPLAGSSINSVLNINLSHTLASGKVGALAMGYEETQ